MYLFNMYVQTHSLLLCHFRNVREGKLTLNICKVPFRAAFRPEIWREILVKIRAPEGEERPRFYI